MTLLRLRSLFYCALLLPVFLVQPACTPSRYIGKEDVLLQRNTIKTDSIHFDKEELESLIKQKPNRKILGVFYPYVYFYHKGSKGKPNGFKNWLKEIGEEPAILDTALIKRSRNQLDLFMKKRGYFNATVTDSVLLNHKRANVVYQIDPGTPYLLRKLEFNTRDSVLEPLMKEITGATLLHSGNNYDENEFEKERDRITNLLKNRGFYSFSKNFITYRVDSSVGDHRVDLVVYLNRLNENAITTKGAAPEYHTPYQFRNIYIQSDFDPKNPSITSIKDTLEYKDLKFVSHTGFQNIRSSSMSNCIFFRPGEAYNQDAVNYTYQRIQNLNVFKYINIGFKEVPRDSSQPKFLLDGFLQLSAMARQDFTVEALSTNTGGNLGLAGSFGYRNKNLFRGAEVLEFKMKGGVQSLPNFSDSTIEKKLFFFNTYELGPELSLQFKDFLLPEFIWRSERSRRMNPRTILSSGYNLQDRPDYRRSIFKLSAAYTWRRGLANSYYFSPVEINSVSVKKSAAFQQQLDNIQSPQLKYSYDTHLITAMRFSYSYSGQAKGKSSFIYLRASMETAGLLLKGLAGPLHLSRNEQGIYEFVGIPFSQYLKPEIDFSYHQKLNKNSSLIYRLNTGVGIPYGNSGSLPFEKSYFVGGANSMRAWIAYTLGPGPYVNNQGIEQSGDIKLETNVEYRSYLLRFMGSGSIEAAVFTDIGNIWTLNEDANRPGARFNDKLFLNELGVGSGLGLRFNFTFFILRLDLAAKMRDPGLEAGKRWVYGSHKFVIGDVTPNLAIGYPF